MSPEEFWDIAEEEQLLKADGFDDCIIGLAYRSGIGNLIAYDVSKIIKKLMLDNMTEEEAYEFFDYNISDSYMGEKTPVFIYSLEVINSSNSENIIRKNRVEMLEF